MDERLIVVLGPTATGKTELGIRLAEEFDGEIVSADSRQVYRFMDIGAAKPTAEQRARTPHHLIDFLYPDQDFGLAEFLRLARQSIQSIRDNGRLPIVVGGTGQYIWALLENWKVPRVPPNRRCGVSWRIWRPRAGMRFYIKCSCSQTPSPPGE